MKILKLSTFIIVVLLLILALFTPLSAWNKNYGVFAMIIMILGIFIFFYFQQHCEQRGNWIKPSNLLLIGIVGTCFQPFADILVGYKDINDRLLSSSYVLNISAIISSLALISYILGYMLLKLPLQKKRAMSSKSHDIIIVRQNYIIIIIQIIAFLAWIAHINIAEFLSGAIYFSSNDVLESNYYELFLQTAIYSELILLVINGKKQEYGATKFKIFLHQIPTITLVITLSYIFLRLISGDRGPVIYIICAYLYSYISLSHKKYSFTLVVFLVFFAALGITLLGIFRVAGSEKSISEKLLYAWDTFEDGSTKNSSVFPPTKELTISFSCNQAAIRSIQENNESYHYGSYQLAYIVNTIPFGSSFMQNTLGIQHENVSSSYYVSKRVLGENANWSLGTTSVADYYLEGGALGVLIGFLLLGACFRKFDQWIYFNYLGCHSTVMYTVLLVCVSHAIYIPRSSLLHEFKPVLIILAIFSIYYLLIDKIKIK